MSWIFAYIAIVKDEENSQEWQNTTNKSVKGH